MDLISHMGLRFYNTATRKLEDFTPLNPEVVTMYNCGPTVYSYQHIGNMRAMVFADTIRRTLEWSGYKVKQIINITDVGLLVSDSDEGEDKMELAVAREHTSAEEVIKKYTDTFIADLRSLNIKKASEYPEGFPRATMHISEQIALIKILEEKGYTYRTSDGIYFDTSKFPRYADFAKLDIAGLEEGARVKQNAEKRNSTDFALWKFFTHTNEKRAQEWDSPWGVGFPGWHIECSAMSMKYLGETLDIHTGGIEHIPIHHTNEIAQSESATQKQYVRYWMHNAHLLIDGQKMSKSLGNTYVLSDLHERGVPPLAYRYWLLTAHYRTQVNLTWDALAGAQSAYNRLTNYVIEHKKSGGSLIEKYCNEFTSEVNNDLNTANAIALVWKLIKDPEHTEEDKYATLMKFDEVLGLQLASLEAMHDQRATHPTEVSKLLSARQKARDEKNWSESDRLRDELLGLGFEVKDTPEGQRTKPL